MTPETPHLPGNLDVRSVIRFFGGPAQLSRSMQQMDLELPVKTIEQWQMRSSIPSRWIVRLTALAANDGRKFELSDFITYPKQENNA